MSPHQAHSPVPSKSPGEVGALTVWAALTGLLTAFGVSPEKAAAIGGMAAAATPYLIKLALWLRSR